MSCRGTACSMVRAWWCSPVISQGLRRTLPYHETAKLELISHEESVEGSALVRTASDRFESPQVQTTLERLELGRMEVSGDDLIDKLHLVVDLEGMPLG